jgi:integrase/recombinase XerD
MVMRSQGDMAGPLSGFEDGFRGRLVELGYTPDGAAGQVRLMADLSAYLAIEGLDVVQLDSEVVGRFLTARRAAGRRAVTPRAVGPLLGYLASRGVVASPGARAAASSAAERLLDGYRCYLVRERGLAPGTVRGYMDDARVFLSGLPRPDDPDLECVSAADVTAFVLGLARARGQAPRSGKNLSSATTRLRSLLRFLFLEGRTPLLLAGAVPPPARWRAAALPRALDAHSVSALLEGCDQSKAVGQRDFAILTILVRLGLRSGEVTRLQLDDVDWRAGELLVRGKANRVEKLPVPCDVGEAMTGYLREARPNSPCRALFLRALAPHRELTPGAIGMIVALACDRAGLARVGAHRLRHTAATEMLRGGASLAEIGDVLRHRRAATTAIYAKVDRAALAVLARPWPTEGGPS